MKVVPTRNVSRKSSLAHRRRGRGRRLALLAGACSLGVAALSVPAAPAQAADFYAWQMVRLDEPYSNIVLSAVNGAKAQREFANPRVVRQYWKFEWLGPNRYMLRNQATGTCLAHLSDVAPGEYALDMRACDRKGIVQWWVDTTATTCVTASEGLCGSYRTYTFRGIGRTWAFTAFGPGEYS